MKWMTLAGCGAKGPTMRRWTVVLLLALMIPLAAGCYGRFPLTRALYELNGNMTDSSIIHSVALWVFAALPVYSIAMIGDAFIFNLVEFWTGEETSIDVQTAYTVDGARVTLAPSADGKDAVLRVNRQDKLEQEIRFVRVSADCVEARAGDRVVGRVVRSDNGDLLLQSAAGETERTLDAEQLAAMQTR